MGNSKSIDIPASDPSEPYFVLFFQKPNKIRIVLADKETVEIIRRSCLNSWPNGFSKDKYEADGSYVMKFNGSPWASSDRETATASKIVAIRILCDLYAAGWDCLFASDLSRDQDDLSTWFFEHASPVGRQTPSIICLSISSSDCLRLIPNEHETNQVLKDAVQRSYAAGVQEERSNQGQCYELKVHGNPWSSAVKEEGIKARRMVLEIIRQFHVRGYRFYVTANFKDTAYCLFFIQQTAADPSTSEKFCMISLNAKDRLRMIDCPMEIIELTRQTITDSWASGLKTESDLGMCSGNEYTWEFETNGWPWLANVREAVQCRQFLTHLFNNLLQHGWCTVAALDVTRGENEKAAFVLRSCKPARVPHFCVSLNEASILRLIGAGEDIINVTRRVIAGAWPWGTSREIDFYGSREFNMHGAPWHTTGNERCLSTAMMCLLLAALSKLGWRVFLSANVSTTVLPSSYLSESDFSVDVHSWFVVFPAGVTQSSPAAAAAPEEWSLQALPSYHEATKK